MTETQTIPKKLPFKELFLITLLLIAVGAGTAAAYLQWKKASTLEMETTKLKSMVNKKGAEGSQLEVEFAALEAERNEMKLKYDEMKSTYDGIVADRDNLLNQIKIAYEERDTAYSSIEGLETGRDEAEQKVEDLENELSKVKEGMEPLQKKLEVMEQKKNEWIEERANLHMTIESLEDDVRIAQAKSGMDELNTKALMAVQKIEELEGQLGNAKQAVKAREEIEKVLDKTRHELQQLQIQFESVSTENQNLQHQLIKIPGDLSKITAERDRAIKENADMHYNLGVLFAENRQYEQAVIEFERSLAIRPRDPQCHYNLGVIYSEHLRNEEKAVEHLRTYIQMKPDAEDGNWVRQMIASLQSWRGQQRLA